MHTILLVSAFAALAAAVPSQQSGLDFAAIADAVPASITGPPATAVTQDVYNSAVASSAAAAEVSSDPLHKRSKRQLGENGKGPWLLSKYRWV
ncbi:MAG: hypothetical protein M1812_007457 [Candelaria pacifica]|nr:MAG: hypothetical protein M1812_007457 [Candelaria pacifica]